MSRHPEQERAVNYLRRRGTDAPTDEVRNKVAATFARLEEALAEIGPERAVVRPDPRTWCVQEVVNHLALSLEPGIVQLHSVVDDLPTGDPIAAGLLDADAMAVSWPDAVARLARAHARFLEAFDRAGETGLPLDRTLPALMLLQVDDGSGRRVPMEWIEPLDWKAFAIVAHVHTLEHIDQISRILARLDRP